MVVHYKPYSLKYTLNEPYNPKAYPEDHKRTLDNRLQRIRTGPANPAGRPSV